MQNLRCTVEQALASADTHARSHDYRRALRWLAAAEAVDGELPPEYSAKHRTWARAIEAERYAARAERGAAAAAANYVRTARLTDRGGRRRPRNGAGAPAGSRS